MGREKARPCGLSNPSAKTTVCQDKTPRRRRSPRHADQSHLRRAIRLTDAATTTPPATHPRRALLHPRSPGGVSTDGAGISPDDGDRALLGASHEKRRDGCHRAFKDGLSKRRPQGRRSTNRPTASAAAAAEGGGPEERGTHHTESHSGRLRNVGGDGDLEIRLGAGAQLAQGPITAAGTGLLPKVIG